MDATLIWIDSDDEVVRARALVERRTPIHRADVGLGREAQARRSPDTRKSMAPPAGDVADLIRHLMD